MWPQVTVYLAGAPVFHRKKKFTVAPGQGKIWGPNTQPKYAIANCCQTVCPSEYKRAVVWTCYSDSTFYRITLVLVISVATAVKRTAIFYQTVFVSSMLCENEVGKLLIVFRLLFFVAVICRLIGGLYGRAVGLLFVYLHGGPPFTETWLWLDPGAFALMGAASFFAGVTRLTFSLTIILVRRQHTVVVYWGSCAQGWRGSRFCSMR